jgi:hypothetical protein
VIWKKSAFQKTSKNAFSRNFDSKLKVEKPENTPRKNSGKSVHKFPKCHFGVFRVSLFATLYTGNTKSTEKKKCKSVKFRNFGFEIFGFFVNLCKVSPNLRNPRNPNFPEIPRGTAARRFLWKQGFSGSGISESPKFRNAQNVLWFPNSRFPKSGNRSPKTPKIDWFLHFISRYSRETAKTWKNPWDFQEFQKISVA